MLANSLTVKWFRRTIASIFFVGYIPPMPGTIGSAVAIGLLWFARGRVESFSGPLWWMAILGGIYVSMVLCNNARETFGQEDPPQIVIDELLGQLITFFMVPLTWRVLITGFVLFRFFDIVKPFPIHKMEEIEGGAGVVMDDVVAGLWANASLWAILYTYDAVMAYL